MTRGSAVAKNSHELPASPCKMTTTGARSPKGCKTEFNAIQLKEIPSACHTWTIPLDRPTFLKEVQRKTCNRRPQVFPLILWNESITIHKGVIE